MSKKELKAAISELDRDQLSDLILDLYSNVKQAKDYLDFYANPDENAKADEIREKIFKEFFPGRRIGKCRFSPCKKLISDFSKMGASPDLVLDLMIFLCEMAHEAFKAYGMNYESFHTSTARNIAAAMNYAVKHNLCAKEQERLEDLCTFAYNYIAYGAYDLASDAMSAFEDALED